MGLNDLIWGAAESDAAEYREPRVDAHAHQKIITYMDHSKT